MATSVTSGVFTWTWTENREVGQFANGDWWVIGPITIQSITPADAAPGDGTHLNGTMVNPTSGSWGLVTDPFNFTQGWDSRSTQTTYDEDLNIARQLPISVVAGSSVVSCTSRASYDPGAGGNPSFMDRARILTVLATAPAAGSFRPTVQGTDKSIRWNKSDIDYTKLRNLTPVAGTPTLTAETDCGYDNGGYIGHYHSNAEINSASPYYNLPVQGGNYGPQHQQQSTLAALLLNMDYPEATKENLAIHFIQWGLDCFSYLENTRVMYAASGGQMGGRKLPVLMAGVLLNDADIISMCSERGGWSAANNRMRFAENQQFRFITEAQIDFLDYTASEVGRANWAPNWEDQPTNTANVWGTSGVSSYRDVTNHQWVGTALAIRIMGLADEWDGVTSGDLGSPYAGAFMDYYSPTGHYQELFPFGNNDVETWIEDAYTAFWGANSDVTISVISGVDHRASYSLDAAPTITLSISGPADAIYYTTNGDTPNSTKTLYSAPFTWGFGADTTNTLKVIATQEGDDASAVVQTAITILPSGTPAAPVNLVIS